jgi:hypothetical protein
MHFECNPFNSPLTEGNGGEQVDQIMNEQQQQGIP